MSVCGSSERSCVETYFGHLYNASEVPVSDLRWLLSVPRRIKSFYCDKPPKPQKQQVGSEFI